MNKIKGKKMKEIINNNYYYIYISDYDLTFYPSYSMRFNTLEEAKAEVEKFDLAGITAYVVDTETAINSKHNEFSNF